MIEGRKKRRKRGREKMKKMPQTAQTVMKQKPKGQLPCSFIHFRIFFFFSYKVISYQSLNNRCPQKGALGPSAGTCS